MSNAAPAVERIVNGSVESNKTGWSASSGVMTKSSSDHAHTGVRKTWLSGYGSGNTEYVYQQLALPGTPPPPRP